MGEPINLRQKINTAGKFLSKEIIRELRIRRLMDRRNRAVIDEETDRHQGEITSGIYRIGASRTLMFHSGKPFNQLCIYCLFLF